MKKIIIAIICLSFFGISFAQTEQADAEYLNIQKEYILNEDGSIDFHYTKELKLLSHYAFHRLYGETFIITNTDFQTLKINEAYTIMADGKKVVTPDNAFNEVLPRFANNAPAYNHIREMVVTHTGLEVGAVIYLNYTIHSEKGFYPALMADDVLDESSPVKQLEVKVRIPESKNFQFALLNIEGDPAITNENEQKVYTWAFRDLAANSKESHRLSGHLDDPRLLFSSAENMEEMYQLFVSQEAFNLQTNASMDAMVEKLVAENPDQLSLALALQKEISENMDNLYIPLEYTGFTCRTPVETWNSNQGTGLEKALLLTALLHKANITAEVVAIVPNVLYKSAMGNLFIFNDFAVRMETENYGEIILSPQHTDKQNMAFSLADKTLLVLDKNNNTPEVIPASETSNKITVEGTFKLKKSTLSGQMNIVLEANANPYFSIMQDANAVKLLLNGGIGAKDITTITNVQLSQEKSHSHLNIEKAEPLEKLHDYRIFEIPRVSNGVDSWHIKILPAKRTSDFEIPEALHESYQYKIVLEDDMKAVTEPTQIEINNNAGYLLIKFEQDGNALTVTREIKFTETIISPDKYDGFEEIMDVWNNTNYRKLIFKQ